MEMGLQQLAQAIYDGRSGLTVRLLPLGTQAQEVDTEPVDSDVLTNATLRAWLAGAVVDDEKQRRGEDGSARARVAQDALVLRRLTGEIETTVAEIGEHADYVEVADVEANSTETKGKPYVAQHGLSDTDKLRTRLSDLSEKLARWNTMYDILNGNDGEPDGAAA